MKNLKVLSKIGVITLSIFCLTACKGNPKTKEDIERNKIKIGMVTDAGTIDDKSFNQGTWEGIKQYENDHEEVSVQYSQPKEASTQSFLEAIDNLVLAGNEMIIVPGYSFGEAIGQAQKTYTDTKFVLIDGEPFTTDESGQAVYEIADNTISISFSEQEAGFLAGIASAFQSKTGKVAFLGGVEVPAVQKLGWGFVAGVAYANRYLGTTTDVVDYVYQGTFTDTDAGKSIAGGLFDKGVDILFAAAGSVGVGAINEAKTRAENGENVLMVGVDVDQYEEGIISDGTSVILTSAIKKLGNVAYEQIDKFVNGTFEGGTKHLMNISTDGVGLPKENPNMNKEVANQVNEVLELVKSGEISVPSSKDMLKTFLDELGISFNLSF